jgi:hypothetical protein
MENTEDNLLKKLAGQPNLYHISQYVCTGYDTYSDAVVTAWSLDEARFIHPSLGKLSIQINEDDFNHYDSSWPMPAYVIAELIGVAIAGTEPDIVICASFHAG